MELKLIINNASTIPSALALLIILSFMTGVFAFTPLGGKCDYSRDCAQGYCNSNICKLPDVIEKFDVKGNCTNTIDCDNGFCMSGQCILPRADSFNIFNPGAGTQSSCAGVIDNCTGFWCLFCNVTWLLLAIGAVAAAFVSRKSGKMLPVLMFILPITAGIVIFPFAGIILAVIEVFIIAFLKAPLLKLVPIRLSEGPKPPLQPSLPPPAVPSEEVPATPPETPPTV